jgi:hypothetical protein
MPNDAQISHTNFFQRNVIKKLSLLLLQGFVIFKRDKTKGEIVGFSKWRFVLTLLE